MNRPYRPLPLPLSLSKTFLRTGLLLIVAISLLPASPAAALSCDRSGCGSILTPGCGGTPATPVPSSFWGELQPTDSGQLPSNRDASAFNEFGQQYSSVNWYTGIAIENNYLFTGIAHGLMVWDLRQDPAHPTFVSRMGDSSFLVLSDPPELKQPLTDISVPAGDDTIAALSGEGQLGILVVNLADKGHPSVIYQNNLKKGEEVYATKIGATEYAFLAAFSGSPAGGIFAYNLTAARQYHGCSEQVPAAGAQTQCPGVFLGKIGSSTSATFVHGVDNYVAFSSGGSGFEIWDVSNPQAPRQLLTGLNAPSPTCQFGTPAVYGVAMWKEGTRYYIGLRDQIYSCAQNRSVNEARIYDVSCIAGGPCTLGNPLWSKELYNDGTSNYYVTFSRSGGNDYLYYGSDDKCAGTSQREYLFDVTVPSLSRDITPPNGYWGWYYRGSPTGFNNVMPRRGKFNGSYFYRAAWSIMDVHQRTGGVAPSAAFNYGPAQIYPGDTVSFTDQSSGVPTSWSWSFGPDGTPTGGTSASSQNPQVKFAAKGTKTVSLAATNSVGTSPAASQQVTVLDPAPQIGGITVSPASPLQCQPVTLTATGVTGQATLGYSWKVTDANSAVAPGGTSAANPFVWDTHLNNPLPQAYTATITLSNGAGTASKSAAFTLGALPALPTASFSPTNLPFAAGTVQLGVSVAGATEWNWDFGDGAGFTGWTSDPIAGPNPSHTYTTTGNKTVRVKVRNCLSDPNGLQSAPLTVDILQISPLVASFSASCAFAPCSFGTGQAVTFNDQSQGAQLWDYDWTHNGASAGTCDFTADSGHTSAVASHTYPAAGTFQPCLRVRRGATEANVYVHPAFHVSASNPPPPPTLGISGLATGTAGTPLSFTASASNCTPAANGWSWTLTGGTPPSSTSASPSVTYAANGTYSLSVTNTGCAGALGTWSVTIGSNGNGGSLAATFTVAPAAPAAGQSVTFDGSSSTGNPTLYSWQFGDGTTGSGKTAAHAYSNAGNYNVVLTVCSAATCLSSAPKAIVVGPANGVTPLDPNFTSSATCFNQFGLKECDAQAGVAITLSAVTTQATSYAWDFGDGTSGSGPAVTHTWKSDGSFSVKLTVANSQTSANQTLLFKISPATAVASSVLLPWIAQTRGVLTQTSDLYVHNPGSAPMDVTLEFRRRGTPEDNPPRVTRTVAPGATLFSSDVLNDLFGRPDNTVGFVTVAVPNGAAPIITSYNTTFQSDGTQFGQTISGVSMAPAAANQASSQATEVQHLVALNDNASEVSYFGLSNPNNQPATYRLSLFDNQGKAIGAPTDFVMSRLGLKQFQREEIESLFGVSNVDDYRVQIETISGGHIYPYGAKLRTASFDPSFVGPGETRSKVYVIGALSTPGLNGTLWRSDLVVSNTSGKVIQTTMSFIGVGAASQSLAPVTLTLQPGETQRLANVVADKWGVKDAVGILTFTTDAASSAFPIVQGESYDFSTGVRRFGQSMPALSESAAAGVGQGHYMVGLRQDAGHWTAFWLFNPSSAYGSYDLVYRALDGSVLGKISGVSLPPGKSKLFRPSEHPIPAAGVQGGFTVQIMVHSGEALAAGQVVNLSTNDPAYILGTTR